MQGKLDKVDTHYIFIQTFIPRLNHVGALSFDVENDDVGSVDAFKQIVPGTCVGVVVVVVVFTGFMAAVFVVMVVVHYIGGQGEWDLVESSIPPKQTSPYKRFPLPNFPFRR